jgi:pSer/pThr/pTyr-binding forkhead associated (FHA) protein
MAARLRYLRHDIALPEGTFVIGRSPDCQLTLNDTLVSRRHAAFHVRAGAAEIEDLGSQNGVYLNGVRINGVEPLHDGDQIRIGAQDIAFQDAADSQPRPSSRRETASTKADIRLDEPDEPPEPTVVLGKGPTSRPSGFAIIGGVADKALALGRAGEAERILQRALADAFLGAHRGDLRPEVAEQAAGYALRLAAATGTGSWIDYVIRMYTTLQALLPARLVDELYAVARKVEHVDKPALAAYTAKLREKSDGFGPADLFVLQRIEGFERWAP